MTSETMNPELQEPQAQVPNQAHPKKIFHDSMKQVAERGVSLVDYYSNALANIGKTLDIIWGEVNIESNGRSISRTYQKTDRIDSEMLLELASTLTLACQVDNEAKCQVFQNPEAPHFCLVITPLQSQSGGIIGTLACFVYANDDEHADRRLKQLQSLQQIVQMNLANLSTPEDRPEEKTTSAAQLNATAKASKFKNVTELCFALNNNFCDKYGCQRTALGLIKNQKIEVASISGMDNFVANSPAIVDIRQAMEECYDHGETIVVQHETAQSAQSNAFLLNQKLHDQSGGSAICTVPIRQADRVVGVLTLQRDLSSPFTDQEVESIKESVNAFAPSLELMKKADRTLRGHITDKIKRGINDTLYGDSLKRKIFTFAMVGLAAWFLLGWMPYKPKIPCTVKSHAANHITAPFDGMIANAPMVAGQKINKGQTLVEFDTSEIDSQIVGARAQIKSLAVSRNQALTESRTSEAAVAAAEIRVLQAQLAGLQMQRERAKVVAPFDGTIIRGDLRANIGQPIAVGTQLFELAPNDTMRIEIAIPESTARHIEPGQTACFVLSSRPDKTLQCKVERLTPSTTPVNGRNVVMAEAVLEGDHEWLQSGMEGVAKVNTGWQPVWWISTHKVLDCLRMGFWL